MARRSRHTRKIQATEPCDEGLDAPHASSTSAPSQPCGMILLFALHQEGDLSGSEPLPHLLDPVLHFTQCRVYQILNRRHVRRFPYSDSRLDGEGVVGAQLPAQRAQERPVRSAFDSGLDGDLHASNYGLDYLVEQAAVVTCDDVVDQVRSVFPVAHVLPVHVPDLLGEFTLDVPAERVPGSP